MFDFGGADSDCVLDLCTKVDESGKIDYVWFDTGLEYQATKEHLELLQEKYGIDIIKYKAIKPIPITCKVDGQPFLSKRVSDMIYRLQRHGFQWENESYEVLCEKYPKCKGALKWWCNAWGEGSQFNIDRHKYLKEFILQNPPWFKISSKCCDHAKKKVLHSCIKESGYDLNIYGVRRAEGGNRATAYKSCFTENNGIDEFRPLFWYNDEAKTYYEDVNDITHSKCYSLYGLKRTGCAGCPFGRNFEFELEVIEKYEPKLYKAVNVIFGDSYEYTRRFKAFREEMKNR